jgi:exopolysaccharide biosynthesis polyprenyl glycosylphosphotransferase
MKERARFIFAFTLVLFDVAASGLAFYIGYWVRLRTEYQNIESFDSYWGMLIIHVLSIVVTFFFYRLYHRRRMQSYIDEFYNVFGAASVGVIVSIAVITIIYKSFLDYPRLMMVYNWFFTIIFVTLARMIHSRLRWNLQSHGFGQEKVIIVGTGDVGRIILQKIRQSPGLGYNVVGFVDDSPNRPENVMNVPVLGTSNDIPSIIETQGIKEVIIGMPEASNEEIIGIISKCEREQVSIKVFPDVFQIMASEVSIGDLNGLPLLTMRDIAMRGWRLTLKRTFDMIGSSLLLIVLSPLMMLVAFLVKLDSPGSVFYAQERMGLDARPFMMLKFRSMRKDAEKDTGAVWAKEDDPRRTRLGKLLRRLSIDETPQFINVLLGDMSLVGPRPERPMFVDQFKKSIPRYMERHKEKAGLTGWAQVNGLRGDTSIIERTKYDLWYIENWSLMLDIKIVLRTFINVFRDRNAY